MPLQVRAPSELPVPDTTRKESTVKLARIRSLVAALSLAALSLLVAAASTFADGGAPPFPH